MSEASTQIIFLHAKVNQLLKEKKSEEEIVSILGKQGVDAHYAQMIIDNVETDKSDNKNFWKLLLSGIFVTGGGLAVNYMSYLRAVEKNAPGFWIL